MIVLAPIQTLLGGNIFQFVNGEERARHDLEYIGVPLGPQGASDRGPYGIVAGVQKRLGSTHLLPNFENIGNRQGAAATPEGPQGERRRVGGA